MKSVTKFLTLLLLVAIAASGKAQQVTQKQTLTLAGAKKAILAAVTKAKELSAPDQRVRENYSRRPYTHGGAE